MTPNMYALIPTGIQISNPDLRHIQHATEAWLEPNEDSIVANTTSYQFCATYLPPLDLISMTLMTIRTAFLIAKTRYFNHIDPLVRTFNA